MPIELVPAPMPAVAVAVRQAVQSARVEPDPVNAVYASPWRRAGLEAGTERIGAGASEAGRYGATLSPRKARGAMRA